MTATDDRWGDAEDEVRLDAEWSRHDTHRDSGVPFDPDCRVCREYPEEVEAC